MARTKSAEQPVTVAAEPAGDRPPDSCTPNVLLPMPEEDFGIVEAAAVAEAGSGRAARHDGWTVERIRTFLTVLSQCGIVSDAARAAGISVKSAYALRNRSEGRAFHLAWDAALHLARRRLTDVLMSRAINGWIETTVRNGKVAEQRNRLDNRLGLAMLTHLAGKERNYDDRDTIDRVAREFDQFVDIVCAGGEGAAAFLGGRRDSDGCPAGPEAELLLRLENYKRYKAGLAAEIDISDLTPEGIPDWTEEQVERAELAGLLERMTEPQLLEFQSRRRALRER